MFDNSVDIIKQSVEMKDLCLMYGINVDRKGFARCPYHNEKTASFKIYAGSGGYHCFGCGDSGDVISFVRKFFNLPFKEALKKIDIDFSLNLFGERTFEERRQAHYKQKAIIAERERKKAQRQIVEDDYWREFDEWKRLTDNRSKYRPKSVDEQPHPLFIESLQKLAHQEYLLDCAEEKRLNYA